MFFQTIFKEPIYNIFVFFLDKLSFYDVGIAVILTTILIKIILLPINLKSQKNTYLMKEFQPEIDEIKKEHKGDNKTIGQKTMDLYKKHKINPFVSFFALLIQIPIFIALYKIFIHGAVYDQALIYKFNTFPENINKLAFGFLDLSAKYWWIGVLSGISMFIYSKIQFSSISKLDNLNKSIEKKDGNKFDFKSEMLKNFQKQSLYFFPIISGLIAATLPSILGIYWIVNNIFSIFQDLYIKKKINLEKFIRENKHQEKNEKGRVINVK